MKTALKSLKCLLKWLKKEFDKAKEEKYFFALLNQCLYEPLKVDIRRVPEICKFSAYISLEFGAY
ncbi:MAG TPA: hypothetical protein VNZ49_07845 [Bacteroidia bacterium]|jgi:hypothetical protein|nr:hypothetical protein [Bacteroidia bacterium]